MARREDSGTPLDPGLVQRVADGLRYMVRGVAPNNWFGPGQPIAPQAQEEAAGRQFDYPVGFNYRILPRGEELVSFSQLRALADSYDLMRLVIEKRKDQIEAFDWEIVPRDEKAKTDDLKGGIEEATAFFQMPDKQYNWQQWLRQIIEELLVIDAVCVYPRATRGGGLYGLELVDGATIKRVIDVQGRTPLPPDPAYQQILKGIPAVDYSSDELVYSMRNPRVWKLYGYSPVEQVITTVNIALRRQVSQMSFYTAGNVPEALVQVAAEWTPKQITDYQQNWDAVMEGNLAERRKMKFIPPAKQIDFPKKDLLKDEFDEWLARIVCFAFSISPSALIKQVNRASGEQMADTAKEEGLMPLLRYLESLFSQLLQTKLDQPKLKFRFKLVNRVDPKEQAEIDKTYIDAEVYTADEVRENLGKDPLTPAEREKLWPSAPPPGMNADGTPILPVQAKDEPVPAKLEPTAAEKMLGDALKLLDPERIAKVIADVTRAQPAQVIELKPEVNVEVGDTNVHMPANKGLEAALAKSASDSVKAAEIHAEATNNLAIAVSKLPAAEVNVNVEPAQVTVTIPAQAINVTTPDVKATITVESPEINVDAPVTVNNTTPATTVEVHTEVQGATEEVIQRNEQGDIARIVRKPLK